MSDNESGSGEEFEVEKIMEHRTRKGKVGAVNIETIVREINVVVRCVVLTIVFRVPKEMKFDYKVCLFL